MQVRVALHVASSRLFLAEADGIGQTSLPDVVTTEKRYRRKTPKAWIKHKQPQSWSKQRVLPATARLRVRFGHIAKCFCNPDFGLTATYNAVHRVQRSKI